ncbi:extracellular solute-binding protein [Paraburkholderia sp. GAS199]|uniref:extracellular solute-binding protein n=1 Tax=Paraburkholderia sp. GAS199 TaxID=3035126 RepID=UPI003D237A11
MLKQFALLSLAALAMADTSARADPPLHVTYAGSMGIVMDRGLGPAFAQATGVRYQGQGEGAYGMARLIAAKKIVADVFVSITPGPMQILKEAGLVDRAVPVANTSVVIAFNPRSPYAKRFEMSQAGNGAPWWQVLQTPGLHFGRTDPTVDPGGQNIVFAMKLAQRYYRQPGLAQRILGNVENPREVFADGGVLARLEAGQVDAAQAYESAAISLKLPYIVLPDEINLSNPLFAKSWYDTVSFDVKDASGKSKTLTPEPLVFYAAVLKNSPNPAAAEKFVAFMLSPNGQEIFEKNGYRAPKNATPFE